MLSTYCKRHEHCLGVLLEALLLLDDLLQRDHSSDRTALLEEAVSGFIRDQF